MGLRQESGVGTAWAKLLVSSSLWSLHPLFELDAKESRPKAILISEFPLWFLIPLVPFWPCFWKLSLPPGVLHIFVPWLNALLVRVFFVSWWHASCYSHLAWVRDISQKHSRKKSFHIHWTVCHEVILKGHLPQILKSAHVKTNKYTGFGYQQLSVFWEYYSIKSVYEYTAKFLYTEEEI